MITISTDENGHLTATWDAQPNIYSKMIADSISPSGSRLCTTENNLWRSMLAELNTHRDFSRNSRSSRAVPFSKTVAEVIDNPARPLVFKGEQKGMSAGEPLEDQEAALEKWLECRDAAVETATALYEMGVHKSIVNRVIEPFMWHRVIVTATETENFFAQRCHPDAQDDIRAMAECMRMVMKVSDPTPLNSGSWHLPYINEDTRREVEERSGFIGTVDTMEDYPWQALRQISAARCARVSYLTHDGKRDLEKDMDLYSTLTSANPPHWSPLEHVATPSPWLMHPAEGNFNGWTQLRGFVQMGDL